MPLCHLRRQRVRMSPGRCTCAVALLVVDEGVPVTDVLDLAERLWTGQVTVETHHPVGGGAGGVVEVADGVAFWHGFSNSTIARTDAGLVMVDSGDPLLGRLLHEQVRGWQPDVRLHSAV